MRSAVFAFSRQGCRTALKAKDILCKVGDECRLYTIEKFKTDGFMATTSPLSDFTGPVFSWADVIVFVGGTGIAVRAIAPHVRSKRTDPAVLVTDELGKSVIALLSGHIGGANMLANVLAGGLGAVPVITTATDVNGKFSVDTWAAENGLTICSMDAAKAVSAEILENPVALESDFQIVGELPPGVVSGVRTKVGICISYRDIAPFDRTLLLIPRVLRVGIGCRRGTSAETISDAVAQVFSEYSLRNEAVEAIASIDIKQNETGLLEFADEMNWPLEFYSAEELEKVEGNFTKSDFVRGVTGVDNVCERAAAIDNHRIIINKTPVNGVTVAVGVKNWEVRFG